MINEVAAVGEETTGHKIGYTIGTLLSLKRMVELNMSDIPNYRPFFSKDEVMDMFDKAINKLNDTRYPYTV